MIFNQYFALFWKRYQIWP